MTAGTACNCHRQLLHHPPHVFFGTKQHDFVTATVFPPQARVLPKDKTSKETVLPTLAACSLLGLAVPGYDFATTAVK